MAITNAQQYQQLVNKPANGKRPGYRGPGGYQGSSGSSSSSSSSSSGSNQGPAGGASAGGNYGGNVNAQQTYAGRTFANQNYATQAAINAANKRAAQNAAAAKARAAQIAAEKAEKDRQKREADAAKAAKARAKAIADKKAKDLSNLGKSKTTKFGTVVGPTAKSTLDKFKSIKGQTASINPDEFLGFKEEDDLSLDDAMKSVFGTKSNITIDPNLTASLDDNTKKGIRSLDPDDIREQYGRDYTVKGKAPKTGDLSSELQTFNTSKAVGDTPIDQEFTGTLNKREQALQDFLNKTNEVKMFGLSSLFQKPLQKISDISSKKYRDFFTDVIRAGKIPGLDFDMSAEEFEKQFDKYKDNRANNKIDAYGNPLGNRTYDSSGNLSGGGDNDGSNQLPPIISQQPTTPVTPVPVVGSTTSSDPFSLAPRFMGSIFDFSGGRTLAADGGIMKMRKEYRDLLEEDEMEDPTGGIMDLETGRQQYFLGKLVKKATRAVKKVAKSPLGKAALLYFGGNALAGKMGGFGGLKGKFFGLPKQMIAGPVKGLLGTGSSGTMGILGKLGLTKGGGSFMPTLKGGIGLGLGIPFALDALGVGKEEEDGVDLDSYYASQGLDIDAIRNSPYRYLAPRFVGTKMAADGGLMRTGYQEGGDAEPVAKKTMPLIDMDGMEKDYREDGGFVPIGRMERADDVPARLSKNEFVFTADAVRNAGEGDIDKGAEVMYNMMKNLESGGEVSEESQGLDGAREMFQTSQRLEEVL